MSIKCEQCGAPAIVRIEYGTDAGNEMRDGMPLVVEMCSAHAQVLWARCEPIVNAGLMSWSNFPIGGV